MADLSYSVIMQGIASRLVHDLQQILPRLDSGPASEVLGPVIWVDDLALYVESEVPDRLIDYSR